MAARSQQPYASQQRLRLLGSANSPAAFSARSDSVASPSSESAAIADAATADAAHAAIAAHAAAVAAAVLRRLAEDHDAGNE